MRGREGTSVGGSGALGEVEYCVQSGVDEVGGVEGSWLKGVEEGGGGSGGGGGCRSLDDARRSIARLVLVSKTKQVDEGSWRKPRGKGGKRKAISL